jgi:hypothetical protein
MPRSTPLLALLATLSLTGCTDLCEPSDSPTVELGRGVGGAYASYEEGEAVGLVDAPQGGLGVQVIIRTTGLRTEQSNTATAILDVFIDDELEGTFESNGLQLLCGGAEEGGSIRGQVVGFDQDLYPTINDFIGLNDQTVELRVSVVDLDGEEAAGSVVVTLNVGS